MSKSPEVRVSGKSLAASSFENEEDSLVAGKIEPTNEPEEEFSDAKLDVASVLNPNGTDEIDNQEEVSSLEGTEDSNTSLDTPPIEPLIINISFNPQSEALLEPKIMHQEYLEITSSISTKNVDLGDRSEVSKPKEISHLYKCIIFKRRQMV